ncbi:MAG: hypothetical protein J7L34_03280 [Thermotogaceae bacterium]|nr:hypothetical protein [Thermotogaceae bacterium]
MKGRFSYVRLCFYTVTGKVPLVNLNDRWMRKPVAVLRGNAYRIQQLMNLRYNPDEEDV